MVTGGSRGLGLHIARFLAGEGVHRAPTARTQSGLIQTADTIRNPNINVEIFPLDITDFSALEALLQQVMQTFGSLDILVNNAGMERVSSYTDLSPDFIKTMIRTNLIAPMLLTRLALPNMLWQKSAHVVIMSSMGGKQGNPYGGTYSGTKAGLIKWSRGLRLELQNSGAGVSVICPGFVVESGMFAEYNKKPPWISRQTTPDKVARAVVQAIRNNIGEIVANPGPAWLVPVLDSIHPGITDRLYRIGWVHAFYCRQAEDNRKKMTQQDNQPETGKDLTPA